MIDATRRRMPRAVMIQIPETLILRYTVMLLVLVGSALPLNAQDARADATQAALEYFFARERINDLSNVVLDVRRTRLGDDYGATDVQPLAARLGLRVGALESYCSSQAPDSTGRRREAVVGTGAAVFARIQEADDETATVVIHSFQGGGSSTGGGMRLTVNRAGDRWEVDQDTAIMFAGTSCRVALRAYPTDPP